MGRGGSVVPFLGFGVLRNVFRILSYIVLVHVSKAVIGFLAGFLFLTYVSKQIYHEDEFTARHIWEHSRVESDGCEAEKCHLIEKLPPPQKSLKILCWIVVTDPREHSRCNDIKATWGRRCNRFLCMKPMDHKSEDDYDDVTDDADDERKAYYWNIMMTLKHIYDHHLNDYDIFLQADNDVYVILENLEFALLVEGVSGKAYFSAIPQLPPNAKIAPVSTIFGLTRGGLRVMAEQGLAPGGRCGALMQMGYNSSGTNTCELCTCMNSLGVPAANLSSVARSVKDVQKVARTINLSTDPLFYYWLYGPQNPSQQQPSGCCRAEVLSFHFVPPYQMYTFEYLVYKLRPHGHHEALEQREAEFRAKRAKQREDTDKMNFVRELNVAK